MTFGRIPFGRIPFGQIPFSRIPFGRIPFGRHKNGNKRCNRFLIEWHSACWPKCLAVKCFSTKRRVAFKSDWRLAREKHSFIFRWRNKKRFMSLKPEQPSRFAQSKDKPEKQTKMLKIDSAWMHSAKRRRLQNPYQPQLAILSNICFTFFVYQFLLGPFI